LIAVSICQEHATVKWHGGASPNAFFAMPSSVIDV
jgi:hypothetical protein